MKRIATLAAVAALSGFAFTPALAAPVSVPSGGGGEAVLALPVIAVMIHLQNQFEGGYRCNKQGLAYKLVPDANTGVRGVCVKDPAAVAAFRASYPAEWLAKFGY